MRRSSEVEQYLAPAAPADPNGQDLETLLQARWNFAGSGGTIAPGRLERAVQAARIAPGMASYATNGAPAKLRNLLRSDFVELVCHPIPALEDSVIRQWIVTSIGGNAERCLHNFVRAMLALHANPLELLSGRRPHGDVADGRYFAVAAMIPGSRVPLPE